MRAAVWLVVAVGCGRIDFTPLTDTGTDTGAPSCVAHLVGDGGTQTCVVRADRTLWCKGKNIDGEVGDGTNLERTELVGPILDDVQTVHGGEFHTCATRSDNLPLCWGFNNYGGVGDGTMVNRPSPTPVQGLTGVAQLVTGETHTCARSISGGLSCWGLNNPGVFGDGTIIDSPVPVTSNIAGIEEVASADDVTCVRIGGQVQCTGAGSLVGDGTNMSRTSFVPVNLPRPASHIAGGCHRHMCAILDDTSVWCWGENVDGELGDGTFTPRNAPVRAGTLTGVTQVSLGAYHTCAVSNGAMYCWGQGADGQRTGAVAGLVNTPTLVPFVSNVDEIGLGCRHTCARTGSAIQCWGTYEYGAAIILPPTPLTVPGC
jgi:alpha-tubulin suppressor-like RCC1 family protein